MTEEFSQLKHQLLDTWSNAKSKRRMAAREMFLEKFEVMEFQHRELTEENARLKDMFQAFGEIVIFHCRCVDQALAEGAKTIPSYFAVQSAVKSLSGDPKIGLHPAINKHE